MSTLEELKACAGLEIQAETPRGPRNLALFLRDGRVRAWVNSCPHQGRSLCWAPGEFLFDGERLVCPHHGATFDLESGECISGPCAGAALSPVPVEIRNGSVHLVETD